MIDTDGPLFTIIIELCCRKMLSNYYIRRVRRKSSQRRHNLDSKLEMNHLGQLCERPGRPAEIGMVRFFQKDRAAGSLQILHYSH